MKEESYCKKCQKSKNIKDFIIVTYHYAKIARKILIKIIERKVNIDIINTMNNNIELLTFKINSLEILIKEINKKLTKKG